jgi:hypothetical protein
VAATHKFTAGTQPTGTGTSSTFTSPNTAAGDVAVGDIVIATVGMDGAPGGSGKPTCSPAAGAMTLVCEFDQSASFYNWIGIYICTSAIARNTIYTVSWTTARGIRIVHGTSYSATETFGELVAQGATFATGSSPTGPNASEKVGPVGVAFGGANFPAAATDVTPVSAGGTTGIGYRSIWHNADNSSITPGTGWTSRRAASNTAGAFSWIHDNIRTSGGAYATQATAMTTFATRNGVVVHIPTGAASGGGGGGGAAAKRLLLGVGGV